MPRDDRDRTEGLAQLMEAVLEIDSPDPQLLVRFVDDPNSLSAAQYAHVEETLRRDPAALDQVRVLKTFDLDAALREAGVAEDATPARQGLGARFSDWLSRVRSGMQPALVPAAAAAAALLVAVLTYPLFTGDGEGGADPFSAPGLQTAHAPADPSTAPVAPATLPQVVARAPDLPSTELPREAPEGGEASATPEPFEVARADVPRTSFFRSASDPTGRDVAATSPVRYHNPVGVRARPRGEDPSGVLVALAPQHVGLTRLAAPVLYYHLASALPAGGRLGFALYERDAQTPWLEVELSGPRGSGLQRIDLADLEVELPEGLDLRWSVTWRGPDGSRREAAAWIERASGPEGRGEALALAEDLGRRGVWYDALASVRAALDARPADADAQAAWNRLLVDAELPTLLD